MIFVDIQKLPHDFRLLGRVHSSLFSSIQEAQALDDGVIAPQQEDIDDASRCGHGDISWIGLSWIHLGRVGLS